MKNRFQVQKTFLGLALVDTKSQMTIVNDDGTSFKQNFVIEYGKDMSLLSKKADFCNAHGRNVAAAYSEPKAQQKVQIYFVTK